MPDFQFYFELIGAVAFAISGAALAVKKGMDLFGVAVMGMTTAVGGGILRDMLLGLTPPAALKDPLQALVAIATSLLLFIVWKKWHPSGNHRVWESVLLAADSLGLGIFSVHGAAVAIRAGYGANVFLVLLVDPLLAVRALLVYLAVQFIENQFIYPRVVGKSVGLSPLYTLVAAMIGGKLFGILGILFFIPLTAVVLELVKEDVCRRLRTKETLQ